MAKFILDTSVFIEAAKRYYPFDLCPGFWEALILHFNENELESIDRVRAELLRYEGKKGETKKWVKDVAPASFFASTDEDSVIQTYGQIQVWAQQHPHYLPEAKAEFADTENADAWLVAYALVVKGILITEELSNPQRRNKIPIPDVCNQFGVPWDNTFQMLRRLGVTLTLKNPS